MRRITVVGLALLLALPPGPVVSAPSEGTISGIVRLEGQPKAGVTVAFIELQSGAIVRATTGENGTFEAKAPVGEYAVTTESQAGLTVKQAPVRVAVVEGRVATADLELAAVPSMVLQPPVGGPAASGVPGGEGLPAAVSGAGVGELVETTGAGADLRFTPVTCFVAGEFPLLDAQIEPVASVARARVYFKSAQGSFYYYVEMAQEGGRYIGKLPRPYVEASPITYYLQSTTTDLDERQTREIEAAVVKDKADCQGRVVAAFGPPGPVTVFSAATGVVGTPTGFAAAAASGILVGIITAIAGGAAAAGIVGGVVVGPNQSGPTPPPLIINPSPIPTPEPLPAPTPTPITTFR